MYRFILLILGNILRTRSPSTPISDEALLNPYKSYDKNINKLWILKPFGANDNILTSPSRISYQDYQLNNSVFKIEDHYNLPYNLASKLSRKLTYFMTNGLNPLKHSVDYVRNPFLISSQGSTMMSFFPYGSDQQTIVLKIKEEISKAEILDVVSSSSQVVVFFCRKDGLVKKKNCLDTVYETSNTNTQMLVKFKIISGKIGFATFKIYILSKINDSYLTVVTYSGQYVVNTPHPGFQFQFKQPHFIVRYGQQFSNQLMINNNGKSTIRITGVEVSGNDARISLSSHFSKRLQAQNVKRKLASSDDGITNISLDVTPSENKHLLDLFLFKPDFKDESLAIYSNYTKSTIASEFSMVGNFETERKGGIRGSENGISIFRTNDFNARAHGYYFHNAEEFAHLESCLLTFNIEEKRYFYHLFVFFNFHIFFWEHESINMGVLCDKEVKHEATIYVSNRFNKPIIIESVYLQNDSPDFKIEIATLYNESLILPFTNEKFALLRLIISYNGSLKVSSLKASLVARLDVSNKEFVEKLPIHCTYQDRFIQILARNQEFAITGLENEVYVEIKLNSDVDIVINKLELLPNPGNDNNYVIENIWENINQKTKHTLFADHTHKIFLFKFQMPCHPIRVFKNRFTLTLNTLETFYSCGITFAYDFKLCAVGYYNKNYRVCGGVENIDFGVITIAKTRKEKTLKIKNNKREDLHLLYLYLEDEHPEVDLYLKICIQKKKTGIELVKDFNFRKETLGTSIKLDSVIKSDEILLVTIEITYLRELKKTGQPEKHFAHVFLLEFQNASHLIFNATFHIGNRKTLLRPRIARFSIGNLKRPVYKTFSIFHKMPEKISILGTEVKGRGKEMVQLASINKTNNAMYWITKFKIVIDPLLFLKSQARKKNYLRSWKNFTMKDYENWKQSKAVWKVLKSDGVYPIDIKIIVSTDLAKKVTFRLLGKVFKAGLMKSPFRLKFNPLSKFSLNNLNLQNPFNSTIKFKLFLAPSKFLDSKLLLQEAKIKFKFSEKKDLMDMICLDHPQISVETIRYFASKLLPRSVNFLNHTRDVLHYQNEVCFEVLSREQENEHKNSIRSLSFFFRFTHYDSHEFLAAHFGRKAVILRDIDEYTHYIPKSVKNLEIGDQKIFSFWNFVFEFLSKYKFPRFQNFSSQPQLKLLTDDAKHSYINVYKNLTKYLALKDVFLNPHYVNRSFFIKGLGKLRLKDALVYIPELNKMGFKEPVSLFIKTNDDLLFKVPIRLELNSMDLAHAHINPKAKTSRFPKNLIHFEVKSSEFIKEDLSLASPIVKKITLFNNGSMPIEVTKIVFKNGKRRQNCFQISKLKRKLLRKSKSIDAKLVLSFCRKISSVIKTELEVHSTSRVFHFTVQISFSDFYVALSRENHFKFILFYGQSCIFAFVLIWFSIWVFGMKQRQAQNQVAIKFTNAIFIPKNLMQEKLLLFKFKIDNCKKSNPMEIEKDLFLNELKFPIPEDKQILDLDRYSPKLIEPIEQFGKFVFDPRILPMENQTRIQPVENSNVSFEQICKMFEIDKSNSGERTDDDVNNLLHKAVAAEDINLTENKYGIIGDRNFPPNKDISLSYNLDERRDNSIDKKLEDSKLIPLFSEDNVNTINKIVKSNSKKNQIEQAHEENDGYDDSNSQEKLEKYFDIKPIIPPKKGVQGNGVSNRSGFLKLNDIQLDIQEKNQIHEDNKIAFDLVWKKEHELKFQNSKNTKQNIKKKDSISSSGFPKY